MGEKSAIHGSIIRVSEFCTVIEGSSYSISPRFRGKPSWYTVQRVIIRYITYRITRAGALLGLRGFSAHSMRATFITAALESGATLNDMQRAAGHAELGSTKFNDRRGYNPEKSASFFATY